MHPRRPIFRWLFRSTAGFVRDRSGAVIIEFGLLAPAFIGLLVACIIMGVTAFAQQCVQTSAEAMARKVLTGQTQLAGTDKEAFRRQTCATLPSFMDCARVIVDLQKASNFSSISTTRPELQYDRNGNIVDNWAFDPGAGGDVVILRVLYRWPVSTGPLGFDISNSGAGQRLLMGTMVFKSEPFS